MVQTLEQVCQARGCERGHPIPMGGRGMPPATAGRALSPRLRRILEGQQRVTATFRRPDGRALHVRTTTQAEPEQRAIFDALGIDPQPGRVRKTII